LPARSALVLEDVDSVAPGWDDTERKLSLGGILNALDGLGASIATSPSSLLGAKDVGRMMARFFPDPPNISAQAAATAGHKVISEARLQALPLAHGRRPGSAGMEPHQRIRDQRERIQHGLALRLGTTIPGMRIGYLLCVTGLLPLVTGCQGAPVLSSPAVPPDPSAESAPKALPPITVASVMGEIVWLLTQSSPHKHLFLAALEWLVMPPVLLSQYRIFRVQDRPVGVAFWAFLTEEAEARLKGGRPCLAD
jgi:hypothetical protein